MLKKQRLYSILVILLMAFFSSITPIPLNHMNLEPQMWYQLNISLQKKTLDLDIIYENIMLNLRELMDKT